MRALAALLSLLASPLAAETWHFCWIGAGGYSMAGTMTLVAGAGPIATEADVTAFRIVGFSEGTPIGAWSLADLDATTTWHLRFDVEEEVFPTGGHHLGPAGQAWNANGSVNDCGVPGFGFNSGSNAQDICLDNRFVTASSIDRATPLPASPVKPDRPCSATPLLSKAARP